MTSVTYKLSEFFIIFIVVPVSFALNYNIFIKLAIGLIGFTYIIYVLLKVEHLKFKRNSNIHWKSFWKSTIIKLIIIAIITTVFVWYTNKAALFSVLINKPLQWLVLLFIYSLFSVYPQELIYRTFFFKRYSKLFNSNALLLFVNAIVFALAHIFFKNTIVLVLTGLGGILFALTYKNTKSTLLVSVEHAVYGCWLFTVGMGEMLGFPN
ncbi:CPBP family intramembrane glutamic endopeptidase [Hyunsoonleella sp. 2307UL5-6]|uniref:CPBP family intramembrane glutamic endopeptidase n=1 Tax=Hyunsoonleella sp. 2307UL5-6 TaxID=3384768 RepID=UPI0039BCB579